ncbi:MAG: DUF4908 domain-containing protein [Caulobacteraceae bacterium]
MDFTMVSASRALRGKTVIAASIFAAGLCAFADPAAAAPAWVRKALAMDRAGDRRIAAPPTARYLSDEGRGLVLDRSGRRPLLKFDDSPEVWVLTSSRGPRGDIIYTNDLGEPFLRATKLGGMTVFTSRRPEGSAVALIAPCGPLRLSPIGPVALYNRLYQASARSSRAAQHLIGFDAPDADPGSDGLIADAAGLAVEAMGALSARSGGKALLSRVGEVTLTPGPKPGVSLYGGVMTIVIAPAQGLAGRPSSERILRTLSAR